MVTLSRDGFHTQVGGAWENSKHTHQANSQSTKAKTLCKIHSGASIKLQLGVQDEIRIQEHRTVGKASHERGHVPEEKGAWVY